MPPQNMLLWCIDYYEPKVSEKQQVQQGLLPFPFHLKAGHKMSPEKGAEDSYHQSLEVNVETDLYKQSYKKKCPYLPLACPIYFLVAVPQLTFPLSCHIPTICHSLCEKGYELSALMASSDLHFLSEDSHVHIKRVNKFLCFLLLFICPMSFNFHASHRT